MLASTEPLIEELRPGGGRGGGVFEAWLHCRIVFSLTARHDPVLGRYSFVAADPFEFLQVPADGSDALGIWRGGWTSFTGETIADLPPFQGGAAGLFSYDLAHSLERLPQPRFDEFQRRRWRSVCTTWSPRSTMCKIVRGCIARLAGDDSQPPPASVRSG